MGRRKHRHHRHTPRWRRRLKSFFKKLFEKDEPPKEYRPYLGPEAKPEEVEQRKFENTRARKPRRKRRNPLKALKHWLTPESTGRSRESKKAIRQKRILKRKMRRKKRRADRKRRRIEFIRRFIPDYKRSHTIAEELSATVESADGKDTVRHSKYWVYTVNSTAVFIIAYLIVYMIYQFTVLIVASRWRLDSVLFYYDLQFNDFSPLWNRLNIIVTTISGPVISLLIGALMLRFMANRFNTKKYTKLFMLWVGLHGYNLFLGAFASGTSFDEGFGYVAAWLYMNIFWKILISLIFLFLLGWIGYSSASKFLDTSYSLSRVKAQNKVKFLFYQAILPWFFGALIIFLVRIPNNVPYDTGNLITLAFAVIPTIFNRGAKPSKMFRLEKRQNRIKWIVIAVMVVIVLAYRLGLDNGLHFQIYYKLIFDFNVTPL